MKLYIQQVDGVWGHSQFRDDFDNIPKADYNAQGWYDFEPTPQPDGALNVVNSFEVYLDDENIARYRWTTTMKTGEALDQAIRDKWLLIRIERTELLAKSDFTQVADAPITPEKRAEWVAYRQALRNLTSQADPFNIVWPVSPDGRITQIGIVRV
jgi:hypothetical protein